ncbi:hypothetical protein K8R62_03455 [bacterium]|nr:hypothetical protein [bacterium]
MRDFINELKNFHLTKIYGKDKIVIEKNEKLILISYSAGVIPLFKFAFKNLKNVERIILIAPAGTIHRNFFSHCFAFFKELKYFYSFDKKKTKQILKEVIIDFLKNPIGSIIKIYKIKKFQLEKQVEKTKKEKIKLIKFYSSDDDFMFNIITGLRDRLNRITGIASGHFSIIHNHKNYALKIKRVIEE